MILKSNLEESTLKIIEVDNRVIILELTHINFMIIDIDVMDSYVSFALGNKCDAYSGRLNQVLKRYFLWLMLRKYMVFYIILYL